MVPVFRSRSRICPMSSSMMRVPRFGRGVLMGLVPLTMTPGPV